MWCQSKGPDGQILTIHEDMGFDWSAAGGDAQVLADDEADGFETLQDVLCADVQADQVHQHQSQRLNFPRLNQHTPPSTLLHQRSSTNAPPPTLLHQRSSIDTPPLMLIRQHSSVNALVRLCGNPVCG